MANEPVMDRPALKWRAGSVTTEDDHLAVEEPLEIRLGGRHFTLTMRTPGHDDELAAGFLLAEGFISRHDELSEIRRVRDNKGAPEPNAVDIILNVPATALAERLKRNFTVSSSCGVCGKTSIEALERRIPPLTGKLKLPATTLLRLPFLMRAAQAGFASTGGLHAAALFRLNVAGEPDLLVLREDVGRHNAVDKVVGHALMHGAVPLSDAIMMVSGRLSFEIVQKAAAAGLAIVAAVSAPSSLAVELAEDLGITIVGFLREHNFNVYSQEQRVIV